MTTSTATPTFLLGGDLPVRRLGYGTMQLTGEGYVGPPADREGAVAVLQRAVELGVNLIDTADGYGPFVTDELIRTALHPYRDDLVIATKVGIARPRAGEWVPIGRPEYLRQQLELNLRHLGVDRIDLLQLHRVDPLVPLAEQVGTLAELQQEGKVRHLGLSEVTVAQLDEARAIAPIVSVQNLFNLHQRDAADVLRYAEEHDLAFIPWFPLAGTGLPEPGGAVAELGRRLGASPTQLALAWLLHVSPAMLPIPGTSSLAHLAENVAAGELTLTADEVATIGAWS